MVSEHGHPVGPREQRFFRMIFHAPYWTTLEPPAVREPIPSLRASLATPRAGVPRTAA